MGYKRAEIEHSPALLILSMPCYSKPNLGITFRGKRLQEEFTMRRELKTFVCLGLLILIFGSSHILAAQSKSADKKEKPAPAPLTLKVGDTAPDFTLLAFDGKELKKVSLQDYRGKKNVALAFFVFAFTGG